MIYNNKKEHHHSETPPAEDTGTAPLTARAQSCEPRILHPKKTPFKKRKSQKEQLRKQYHLPLRQREYLGINLSEEAKDLYAKNYKTVSDGSDGSEDSDGSEE